MHNPHNARVSLITKAPGWETAAEESLLMHHARRAPANATIVEIGAEFGMSTAALCYACATGSHVYSVDLFPANLAFMHHANLTECGLVNHNTQIKGDSSTMGKQWKGGEIDLLFIDGSHLYEDVKADIDAWIPHVKVGGVVLFHDCACKTNKQPHWQHVQVQRAVNEWHAVAQWKEYDSVDTIRVFERLV